MQAWLSYMKGKLIYRHSTTIKSLLPLPDDTLPRTSLGHPDNLEDWPQDSQVLALYPHTTTFYTATVKSSPIPGTGFGLGPRGGAPKRIDKDAVNGHYRLQFVDDVEIFEVDKSEVVPVSTWPCCMTLLWKAIDGPVSAFYRQTRNMRVGACCMTILWDMHFYDSSGTLARPSR
jgi:SAGA-associated factor 29